MVLLGSAQPFRWSNSVGPGFVADLLDSRVRIMLNGKNVLSQTQGKKIRENKWEESRDASEN